MVPAKTTAIIAALACCLVVSVLFVVFARRVILTNGNGSKTRRVLPFAFVTVIVLMRYFYLTWLPSSRAAAIARRIGISPRLFISLVSIVLGAFSAYFLTTVSVKLYVFLEDRFSIYKWWGRVKKYCVILVISVVQFIQLENSALYEYNALSSRNILLALVNVWIVLAFNLLIVLIVQSWRVALIFSSAVFFIWSITDYYTVMFHGSPLFFSELVNIRTVAGVVGGYSFPFDENVVFIIVLLGFNLLFSILYMPKREEMLILRRLIIRGAVLLVSIIAVLFLPRLIVETKDAWLPWQVAMSRFGFLICAENDVKEHLITVKVPEGYSEDVLYSCAGPDECTKVSTPDIILILNETFSDLEKYTDLRADKEYMADFYNIPGATYGYAVVPGIGGGTNNSEFELLTSKSMYLLQHAPFTYLNQVLLSRSVVNYLKSLGYETTGMHCANPNNYSRDTAYPAMGFDNTILGQDLFSYHKNNGNRMWLDSENYKDLIDHYEVSSNEPQFMYLLTYQNHGGYEQNDDRQDTVHTQNDYGELTDNVNEYISSVKLSCIAFRELIDYFANVDRDVIICMVGDHAPVFTPSLPARKNNEIDNEGINMRCVPYVVWSNFNINLSATYTDYASMVDLVPMTLQAAGLPLSAFYQEILDLHDVLPIRTSYGQYIDREMNIGTYDLEDKYYDKMKLYYYLEYNSLIEEDEYREDLFEPATN